MVSYKVVLYLVSLFRGDSKLNIGTKINITPVDGTHMISQQPCDSAAKYMLRNDIVLVSVYALRAN